MNPETELKGIIANMEFLTLPKQDKMFLISPPPVGWEQTHEEPPVFNLPAAHMYHEILDAKSRSQSPKQSMEAINLFAEKLTKRLEHVVRQHEDEEMESVDSQAKPIAVVETETVASSLLHVPKTTMLQFPLKEPYQQVQLDLPSILIQETEENFGDSGMISQNRRRIIPQTRRPNAN